jgi:hypothetical protein
MGEGGGFVGEGAHQSLSRAADPAPLRLDQQHAEQVAIDDHPLAPGDAAGGIAGGQLYGDEGQVHGRHYTRVRARVSWIV